MSFLTKKMVPVIKNWLSREGLQFIKAFTNEDKEKYNFSKGLPSMLSRKC